MKVSKDRHIHYQQLFELISLTNNEESIQGSKTATLGFHSILEGPYFKQSTTLTGPFSVEDSFLDELLSPTRS